MSDTLHSDGRRTVGLYMPFTAAGLQVAEISFAPCTFGHLLRWQGGQIASSLALMIELSGRTLHEIESIRHPDDSRVMDAFLDHVHPSIAEDIRQGVRPVASGTGGSYDTPPAPVPGYGPQEAPERGWGEGSATDAFAEYDGIEPAPAGRPVDYVEGLDSP